MASTKEYAYYYPDGSGFFFVSYLGQGTDATASLVQSKADGSYCVRRSTSVSRDPSISIAPKSRVLATLSSEHVLRPAQSASTGPPPPIGTTPSSSVACTYWEYANGGTLLDLIQAYKNEDRTFPSILLWALASHLLEATTAIHTAAITHQDIEVHGNIFVHWPSPTADLPNFVLGDFGSATLWPAAERDNLATNLHAVAREDLDDAINLVNAVREDASKGDWERSEDAEIQNILADMKRLTRHNNYVAFESNLTRIRSTLHQHLAENRPVSSSTSILRTNYQPSPPVITYPTKEALLSNQYHPPGPWRIAEIDHAAKTILLVGDAKYPDSPSVTYQTRVIQEDDTLRAESGLFFPRRGVQGSDATFRTQEIWRYELQDEGRGAESGQYRPWTEKAAGDEFR